MAIRAEVSYRSLKASISYSKLSAFPSIQNVAFALSDTKIFAATNYQELSASISYRYLYAATNWQNIQAVDVHVNPNKTLFTFSDSYSFTDQVSMSFGTGVTDAVSFSDQINNILFGKGTTSTQSIIDNAILGTGKTRSETIGFTDSEVLSIGKNPSDSLSVAESITEIERGDFNYTFEGAATSVSGSQTSTVGFSDAPAFSVSATLQSIFTLDDFSQVDKHASGVKTNVYSLSDDQALNFGKVVSNQSFTFDDDTQFTLSKAASDSIIGVEDSPVFNASVLVSDETEIQDAIALSPRIGSSDSFNFTDDLSFELVIHSSLINKALIGNVLLNAD